MISLIMNIIAFIIWSCILWLAYFKPDRIKPFVLKLSVALILLYIAYDICEIILKGFE